MSNLTKSSWFYQERAVNQAEPFIEIPLKKCTSDQIRAKIEFLQDNFLLEIECEAIEMYVLKIQPEFVARVADVSWMPYNFKNVINKANVQNIKKKELRRRISTYISNVSGSIYSVVKRVVINKITLDHTIYHLKTVVNSMDFDFNKRYNELLEIYKVCQNEIENFKIDYQRTLEQIENFRQVILISGFDKITKRIPGDKYERFVHKRTMATDLLISKFRVSITAAKGMKKALKMKFVELENIRNNVTVIDCMKIEFMSQQLTRNILEKNMIDKNMKDGRKKIRHEYLTEKKKMENYEKALKELDKKITQYSNKITRVNTPLHVPLKSNEDQSGAGDEVPKSENSINEVKHYMEVKNRNSFNIKRIETMEKQLIRKQEMIRFYSQTLKKLLKSD